MSFWKAPGSVYKPHSVQRRGRFTPRSGFLPALHLGDHLSRAHVATRLLQPTRGSGLFRDQETSRLPHIAVHCPCLALLPVGVAWPPALLQAPVVSYTYNAAALPPFHPCRHHQVMPGRSVSVARSDRLPRPGCYPAPCSLECGLSSTLQAPQAVQAGQARQAEPRSPD
jgi:hypothetical protein